MSNVPFAFPWLVMKIDGARGQEFFEPDFKFNLGGNFKVQSFDTILLGKIFEKYI